MAATTAEPTTPALKSNNSTFVFDENDAHRALAALRRECAHTKTMFSREKIHTTDPLGLLGLVYGTDGYDMRFQEHSGIIILILKESGVHYSIKTADETCVTYEDAANVALVALETLPVRRMIQLMSWQLLSSDKTMLHNPFGARAIEARGRRVPSRLLKRGREAEWDEANNKELEEQINSITGGGGVVLVFDRVTVDGQRYWSAKVITAWFSVVPDIYCETVQSMKRAALIVGVANALIMRDHAKRVITATD